MNNQSIFYFTVFMLIISPGCAKLCWFPVIMDIVSLVLSGNCALVGPKLCLMGISWIQNIFPWVFWRSNFFSVAISWVQIFYSWVFCGSKFFSRGKSMDSIFFLKDILWVQIFKTFCKLQ